MTADKRKELQEMKYLINGLFVENYHTYIFGPSGAGKTTIMIHLAFKMIENGYTVVYFYLDGELNTASKISEEIENKSLEDRFMLLAYGTMTDYKDMLDEHIKNNDSLKGTVLRMTVPANRLADQRYVRFFAQLPVETMRHTTDRIF